MIKSQKLFPLRVINIQTVFWNEKKTFVYKTKYTSRVSLSFSFTLITSILLMIIILNLVSFNAKSTQGFSFQIGYCEVDDQLPGRSIPQYTLYLTVANEKERLDWIRALRAGKLTKMWLHCLFFCCCYCIEVNLKCSWPIGTLKKNDICKRFAQQKVFFMYAIL